MKPMKYGSLNMPTNLEDNYIGIRVEICHILTNRVNCAYINSRRITMRCTKESTNFYKH